MKKILILGAGKGQVPFIDMCKNKNYESIVVSIQGNYPGFQLADKYYIADIKDKKAVLEIAKKEKIDAILNQLDIAVPVVAYVNEKLGLPSIGVETALKFTNKYLMMKEAQKIGIIVPKFYSAKTLEEALEKSEYLTYPFIIKPTFASASKGVAKIENRKMLINMFESSISCSSDNTLILEQYIEGQEYIVDSFTQNFKCKELIVGKSKYFNIKDKFIPQSRVFNGINNIEDEIQKRIVDINNKLVTGMKLKYGITHAEYIYSATDDTIYLIEIAARGGGVFIASDLIPLASGINANELLLDYLLGNDIGELKYDDKVAGYFCFLLPKGKVLKIEGLEEVSKLDFVYKCMLENLRVGKVIGEFSDKGSRFGPIIITGKTIEECYKNWAKIKDILKIYVDTEDGEKLAIWE